MKLKDFFNGRAFKVLFSQKYIDENLKYRRGRCVQCGTCCKTFIFGLPCIFLGKQKDATGNIKYHCKIYRFRPKVCRDSPIDAESLKQNHDKNCGYYFVDINNIKIQGRR